MKSGTSFFNASVLRKDITRFAPLWALYAIGAGLVLLLIVSAQSVREYNMANSVMELLQFANVVNFGYGLLCAQMLFGDLFRSRMCNALHALPIRREGWFLTHVTAGLLFSLVPNTMAAVILGIALKKMWWVALLFLAAMTLQFLLYFGTGVFAALCAGNRLGGVAVYGLIHFFSLILYSVISVLYMPMLAGITADQDAFLRFCPLWELTAAGKYGVYTLGYQNIRVFQGIAGEMWLKLGIFAAVGVVFGVLALLLYRKRRLESAGDFIAVKFLRPVFLIVYTMGCGMILYAIADLIVDGLQYLFLAVGLLVGFFTGKMLLSRTVRVFCKKNWLKMGIFAAAVALSFGLVKADVFGIASYMPDPAEIGSVTVSFNGDKYTRTDSEDTIRVHRYILEHPRDRDSSYYAVLRITYTLKGGVKVTREYNLDVKDTELGEQMKPLLSDERFLAGDGGWEEMVSRMNGMNIQQTGDQFAAWQYEAYIKDPAVAEEKTGYDPTPITRQEAEAVLEAVRRDARAGHFSQYSNYEATNPYRIAVYGDIDGRYWCVPPEAENTLTAIRSLTK